MEIRQLRYFVSAVRLGGISASASKNYVTQPAVTLQLKKLEAEVGESLLVRRGGRMVPTPAGRALLPHAEAVLRRLDALTAAAKGLRTLESGTFTIGSIDAASIYVLPPVFRAFRRRHPGVKVQVTVAPTALLIESLRRGEIELAAATFPIEGTDLLTRPVFTDELVLVAHPNHVLSRQRRVRIDDVAGSGLITYPQQSTTRRLIEQVFFDRGLRLNAAMEISSPEAIKRLTQAGLGASILPRALVSAEVRRGTLCAIRVSGARFERVIGIANLGGADLSQAARAFLRRIEERYPDPGKP